MTEEIPVFDRRDTILPIVQSADEWTPARTRIRSQGEPVLQPNDGPSEEYRIRAGVAWYSSHHFRGQHANDNEDWPLAKLLRTERNDLCLRLAERYRALHDAATMPTQLIGREATNLFLVHREDGNGKSKGVKVVAGRKANLDTPAKRIAMAGVDGKAMGAPVAKKWNGDQVILAAIDAKRELAILRARLAYVPKILDAFEWAVCDGLTLDAIGKRLGAGSKGAKGEARARIFDGFEIVDRFWRGRRRAAA
ncbi:hypothetical protein GGE16_002644 [Rhizobium leguminosarum]|uniref:Uncharacterized protein n=1 Tax=Rhizobium leguminosarum TaxID=384 RepID=A0AAE2MJS3_RHILE|nr:MULTISPECIES: hypothetical protein [Rhizobium]MBB4290604.1 hypothetical protein [Rhizobium leguminosarum]MBB4297308.1 hypothetical protein [Rhizobium leguminosarum]MBB4307491.1 hypothetical protein [Rhizobium leguminosarum]MBB4415266.1 hypothetical protein [Rhizobium leguminosarum]MBB4431767.1 hypothetical protein [Rhizobium esperanzae]